MNRKNTSHTDEIRKDMARLSRAAREDALFQPPSPPRRRSVYHEPTDSRVTLYDGAPEEAVCYGGSWQPWRIKALERDYPAPAGWRWQGAGSVAYLVQDAQGLIEPDDEELDARLDDARDFWADGRPQACIQF